MMSFVYLFMFMRLKLERRERFFIIKARLAENS